MGAPEVILSQINGDHADILKQVNDLANDGNRVLLVARIYGAAPDDYETDPKLNPASCPVALVCCSEHIRADAEETLAWFREQGVRCRIISGDNPVTVGAIARKVHLTGEHEPRFMDARELPADITELAQVLENVDVLGRVLPDQKKAIVEALHAGEHVVAMTGDGVNDSPALKKADVGFAMGSGTEVAKEAGDITILDDNFLSIEKAILYGRTMFKSIRKFLIFQLTVNVAAVLTCFLAPLFGENEILTVIQLLVVNLAMDTLAAIAFGSEPALMEYMKEKPIARDASIVTGKMMSQVVVSGLYITAMCLCIRFVPAIQNLFATWNGFAIPVPGEPLAKEVSVMLNSAVFATFMMAISFNGFNARTEHTNPFEHLGRNKNFLLVIGALLVLQFLFVTFGGAVLSVEPLSWTTWLVCLLIAFLIIPIDIIRKAIISKKK
jgi:Ca2+-transporting ATPase